MAAAALSALAETKAAVAAAFSRKRLGTDYDVVHASAGRTPPKRGRGRPPGSTKATKGADTEKTRKKSGSAVSSVDSSLSAAVSDDSDGNYKVVSSKTRKKTRTVEVAQQRRGSSSDESDYGQKVSLGWFIIIGTQ